MTHILFLCTGNYYRSRFAEIFFNHLAVAAGVAARADSCGLRVQADGVVNSGPISRYVVERLRVRNLPVPLERFPRQVTEADLRAAQVVVALKEAEHRPMMKELFPGFADKIRYWHVHDLDAALPEAALAELENLVKALVAECAGAPQCPKSAKS